MHAFRLPQKLLFVMMGLPCSGKSMVAAALSRRFRGSVIISTDDALERRAALYETSYDHEWNNSFSEVNADIQKLSRESFEAGKVVIWDQTNMTVKARRRARANMPRDYKAVLINIKVPMSEIQYRLSRRNELAGARGKFISMGIIENMMKFYAEPTEKEGFNSIITMDNHRAIATVEVGENLDITGDYIADTIIRDLEGPYEF